MYNMHPIQIVIAPYATCIIICHEGTLGVFTPMDVKTRSEQDKRVYVLNPCNILQTTKSDLMDYKSLCLTPH